MSKHVVQITIEFENAEGMQKFIDMLKDTGFAPVIRKIGEPTQQSLPFYKEVAV